MANPEHIEILKQGVEVWNPWRASNPGSVPDLTGADFDDFNLTGVNLRSALLNRTTFTSAKLVMANLSNILYIFDATFQQADLEGADFHNTTLRGGLLNHSNLAATNLIGASFRGTKLKGTSFSRTRMWGTTFVSTDLSVAKDLDAVIHEGPSVLSISTLSDSRGTIPEIFLRGCGVPEEFITYARSLTVQPIQFYSCFISYSSKDQEFADRLYADLQNKGVRCWFAPEDLKIGDRFRDRIDESIRFHDKLLLILSENSVSSQWVGDEVEAAFERERRESRTVLFPIQIDNAVTESTTGWAAAIRRTKHVGDFTRWKDHDSYWKAFERLLRDLRTGA